MAISKDNVKSNFMELSGLDSTSAEVYAGLITVCADEMEKAVDCLLYTSPSPRDCS